MKNIAPIRRRSKIIHIALDNKHQTILLINEIPGLLNQPSVVVPTTVLSQLLQQLTPDEIVSAFTIWCEQSQIFRSEIIVRDLQNGRLLLQDQGLRNIYEKASTRGAIAGHIYLAYCDTGHHKIGWSVDPEKRIRHFDTQMPVEVSIVHSFPTDNARMTESILHYLFEDKRINGEWFHLTTTDITFVCAIKKWRAGWPVHELEDSDLINSMMTLQDATN